LCQRDSRPAKRASIDSILAGLVVLAMHTKSGGEVGASTLRSGSPSRAGKIHHRRSGRISLTPYLFILPAAIVYGVFSFYPMVASMILGFFKWEGVWPTGQFVGFKHYVHVLKDPHFWNGLSHNLIFLCLAVIIPVAVGLFLAIFLAEISHGRTFFRALLFLPCIFSGVVVAYVWKWIYHPFAGVLNGVLDALGLAALKQSWLGDPNIALYSCFAAYAWASFGYSMVIFLAGLQGIEPTIYDAASIDGVSFWQRIWFITIPSLRQVFTFVISLRILSAMGIFSVIFTLTGGGPYYATEVMEIYIYQLISQYDLGWATAAATLQGIIIVGLTMLLMKRSGSEE